MGNNAKQIANETKATTEQMSLGLWDFDDKSSAFVVFDDDDGVRKGFLLHDWRGRPGYTRVRLSELDHCTFVGPIAFVPQDYGTWAPTGGMLGKLIIKQGQATITTIDDDGQVEAVSIAPLRTTPAILHRRVTAEDGDCFWNWTLVDPNSGASVDQAPLFRAKSGYSWANYWISPEYEPDEMGCPFCGQEMPEE